MSDKKTEKVESSYHFLVEKEKAESVFTKQEVIKATGWSPSTVNTYISKKWERFLEKKETGYLVRGVSEFELDEYIRLMSQKDSLSNEPKRPSLATEVERLVIKSREAAIHGLDSYNRPITIFRTEGLTVMMVIAWRSLFHAIFERQGIYYFYTNDDGTPVITDGEEKAWDLSKCVKEYYGEATNPVKANLEFIIGLRNRIEHRYVPALDLHVAGECQALVLNYDELLVEEFSDYYALRESLVFPIQTSNLRSSEQLEAIKRFQGKQYDELRDYLEVYRSSLTDEIYQDPHYSFRVYLIPKIGNHQSSSDIAFEFVKYDPLNPEDMRALEKQVTLIKERQVPVANAGKYKPSQVALMVETQIGRPFSVYYHTKAWKMYGVRESGENPKACKIKYCQFDTVHRDYIYTQEWINFLADKLKNEEEYNRLLAYKDK